MGRPGEKEQVAFAGFVVARFRLDDRPHFGAARRVDEQGAPQTQWTSFQSRQGGQKEGLAAWRLSRSEKTTSGMV